MTKLTYVSALDVAINAVADEAVKEKLTALRGQIEKKNSADRKPTKTQVANEELKGKIAELLSCSSEAMTASDVANAFGISNQKASALLTSMVADEVITREVISRKAYFKAVA